MEKIVVPPLPTNLRGQRAASVIAGTCACYPHQRQVVVLFSNPIKKVITFSGHDKLVTAVAYDERRELFASGDEKGTVKLWQINKETGAIRIIQDRQGLLSGSILDIKFVKNSELCVVVGVSQAQHGCVLNVATGEVAHINAHPHPIYACDTFAREGESAYLVIAAGLNGLITLHKCDGMMSSLVGTIRLQSGTIVMNVAFSPDGKYALACGSDSSVHLIETAQFTCLDTARHNARQTVYDACWSQDGRYVISSSGDCVLKVFELSDNRLIEKQSIQLPSDSLESKPIKLFCLTHADAVMFVVESLRGSLTLFRFYEDTSDVKQMLTINGHNCDIASLLYLGENKIVTLGKTDNQLLLWSRDTTYSDLSFVPGYTAEVIKHDGTLNGIWYDGTYLLATSGNRLCVFILDGLMLKLHREIGLKCPTKKAYVIGPYFVYENTEGKTIEFTDFEGQSSFSFSVKSIGNITWAVTRTASSDFIVAYYDNSKSEKGNVVVCILDSEGKCKQDAVLQYFPCDVTSISFGLYHDLSTGLPKSDIVRMSVGSTKGNLIMYSLPVDGSALPTDLDKFGYDYLDHAVQCVVFPAIQDSSNMAHTFVVCDDHAVVIYSLKKTSRYKCVYELPGQANTQSAMQLIGDGEVLFTANGFFGIICYTAEHLKA